MRPQFSWGTLPAQVALALVIAVVLWLLFMPQMVAMWLLTPELLTGEDKISIPSLLGLWVTPTPTVVTGGASDLLHWVIVVGVIVLALALVIGMAVWHAKRRKNPQLKPGLARVSDVSAELSDKELLRQASVLRPLLAKHKVTPKDVGYRLGEYLGTDIWIKVEDPMIVIGPSRSGKGWNIVLNWILDAPGAVITTSSKMDNLLMTLEARKAITGSRAWVFAPGVPGGTALGHVLRWDPITGCEREDVLVRRIKALIPAGAFGGSTSNGGHWDTIGQQLASHLFHAAALAGENVDKVWEWVGSPQRASEAVKIIREHPQGMVEHATHLETVINQPPEQRASTWGTLPTVLAFMESREARSWMKPEPGEEFDAARFMFEKETIYFVGDKDVSAGYVRIIDGLLSELDHGTKGVAGGLGDRLDPPVTYILDEAANFEYQGLSEIITAGGGRGRVVVAVFQSRQQLKQWGADKAESLWDAASAKIVLPGSADPAGLQDLSKLVGDLWVERESHSWGSGTPSVSVSKQEEAILKPSEIREMEKKYCLLFYRNMKPIVPRMKPFNEHPRYQECVASKKQLSQQLAAQSEYAEAIARYTGVASRK